MDDSNMDFILSTIILSQEGARRNLNAVPVADSVVTNVCSTIYDSKFADQPRHSQNGKDTVKA